MINDFSIDDFLGGLVRLKQPVNGYRATSDAVLLAASVRAKKGQTVLDVGTGTGAVALCIAARCPEALVSAVDIQSEMIEFANENAAFNNKAITVVQGDIRDKLPLPTGAFDWVVTNPPFILEDQVSPNPIRDKAHRESDCSLPEWISNCLRYIKPLGYFAMINRADRLPEILSLLYGKVAGIRIIPIWTKENEPAKRVIVIGRKGSKSPAILEKGVILMASDGTRTSHAESIMRLGADLLI